MGVEDDLLVELALLSEVGWLLDLDLFPFLGDSFG